MQSIREGIVMVVRFRLGSARLDIEDPTNRHLGWVSHLGRACHALSRVTTNTGCIKICQHRC